MSDWKKCSEHMPWTNALGISQKVLIVHDELGVRTAKYHKDGFERFLDCQWSIDGGIYAQANRVTHWMRLPDPPAQEVP